MKTFPYTLSKETAFLAYHIRKCSALEFNYHGQAVLFSDSICTSDDKLYQYNVRNHVRKHRISGPIVPLDTMEYDTPFLCKRGNFICFDNKIYYILSRDQRVFPKTEMNDFAVDCLLLRQKWWRTGQIHRFTLTGGGLSVWRTAFRLRLLEKEKSMEEDSFKFCIFAACFFRI